MDTACIRPGSRSWRKPRLDGASRSLFRDAGAALVVAGLLGAAGSARAAPPSTADLRTAVKAAAAGLDNAFLKDGPGPAAAVQREWISARAWLGEWMRLHPAAPAPAAAAALQAAVGVRPDAFEVTAAALDARSLLVTATSGSLGDAFILRRGDDGRVVTAWAVEAPGAAAAAAYPAIQAWSPSRADSGCGERRPRADRAACGPLTAGAGVLPAEADGARRFYLDGIYGQDAGATGGQLVTVWRWDGRVATPLLARTFSFMIDQSQPLVAVDARHMRVGSKGDWRETFACGGCEGRQTTTEVVLPDRGASWGAATSLTPEVDAVDALYDRVAHGRPADDLAEPAVLAAVRAQVRASRAETPPGKDDPYPSVLSMLMSWKATSQGGRRLLCLSTDTGAQLFTLVRAGGGLRVTAVRGVDEKTCEGAGSHT